MAILVPARRSLGLSATRPDLTEYHRRSGDRMRSRDNETRRGHRLGAPRVAFWHVDDDSPVSCNFVQSRNCGQREGPARDLKRSVLSRFRSLQSDTRSTTDVERTRATQRTIRRWRSTTCRRYPLLPGTPWSFASSSNVGPAAKTPRSAAAALGVGRELRCVPTTPLSRRSKE
jgi:hypothetical protein